MTYSPETLLDLWRKHQVAQHTPGKFTFSKLTVAELREAFYVRQVKRKTLKPDAERRFLAIEAAQHIRNFDLRYNSGMRDLFRGGGL